jgi:hypothetical protein
MITSIDEQISAVKYSRDMIRNTTKKKQFTDEYARMVVALNDATASLAALKLLQHEAGK